jgi:antitoxin ParD1/3/4
MPEDRDRPMVTRSIVLTDREEAFVSELVRSGRYRNASEVLHEGLRLMERRESLEAAKLDALLDSAVDMDRGTTF